MKQNEKAFILIQNDDVLKESETVYGISDMVLLQMLSL